MELLQLKYFLETARLSHMSKAAEALHIAQPSLSQTIKRLEEELGTPLFDRKGRSICLNQAGHIFQKYAQEVFQSLENASLELSEHLEQENLRFSLCIQSASLLLPDIIGLLKREIKGIQIQIYQTPIDLQASQADFTLSSDWRVTPDSHTRILLEEPLVLALPAAHPLAARETLDLSDLKALDFISLNSTGKLFHIISHYCRAYGFTPNITTWVDNPGIMRDLLKSGLGTAFIPLVTWKHFFGGQVVFKTLPEAPMKRYLTLTCHPSRYLSGNKKKCLDLLCGYFTSLSQQAF